MDFTNLLIKPPVIGHRGACRYAPENTLASFREAKKICVNWVEFDVMLTADDVAVVIHDESLDRTTTGKGLVIDHSYSYIQSLDAGSWFNSQFANEKIPTLHEVMTLLAELKLAANVEIKAQDGNAEQTVKQVLSILKNYEKKLVSPPLISSFSLPILKWVRHYSPSSQIGFLMHEWNPDWEKHCDELNAVSVNVNEEILNANVVKDIKASKRALLTYTVNDYARAQELFSWGVDAVFSDCPDKIIKP